MPIDPNVDTVARTLWGEARGTGLLDMLGVVVIAGTKMALPQFWCNLAVGWRNLHESREPLCDCFAWSFAACGDFFEVAVWSFGIRSFRQHTLPSPSSVQRPTPHVLRAAASPAAGTAAIPGS